MDENLTIILLFSLFSATVVLLFVGSLRAAKGKIFWAVRFLKIGATLMLIGTIVAGVVLFWHVFSLGFYKVGMLIGATFYLVMIAGGLSHLIGFLGFSIRWGATGKRRAELIEITAALSAARDQAQRSLEAPTLSPNTCLLYTSDAADE